MKFVHGKRQDRLSTFCRAIPATSAKPNKTQADIGLSNLVLYMVHSTCSSANHSPSMKRLPENRITILSPLKVGVHQRNRHQKRDTLCQGHPHAQNDEDCERSVLEIGELQLARPKLYSPAQVLFRVAIRGRGRFELQVLPVGAL